MKTDQAKELAEQGLTELHEALKQGKSETLVRFLTVMSRFHSYSFNNAMMIMMQCPEATLVAGFRKWQSMKRQVRKGQKGIAIFAPMSYRRKVKDEDTNQETVVHSLRGFKVVHVFDLSQTDGEDLPEFSKLSGDPGHHLERLEEVIREWGIELNYQDLPLLVEGSSTDGKITVDQKLSPADRFAVLAHELAHEMLHKGERRHETDKTIRETEAEAVAFVVCRVVGIDSTVRSADYIQLKRGDTDTLAESLSFIQKTAAAIIEALNAAPSSGPDSSPLPPSTSEGGRQPQLVETTAAAEPVTKQQTFLFET